MYPLKSASASRIGLQRNFLLTSHLLFSTMLKWALNDCYYIILTKECFFLFLSSPSSSQDLSSSGRSLPVKPVKLCGIRAKTFYRNQQRRRWNDLFQIVYICTIINKVFVLSLAPDYWYLLFSKKSLESKGGQNIQGDRREKWLLLIGQLYGYCFSGHLGGHKKSFPCVLPK